MIWPPAWAEPAKKKAEHPLQTVSACPHRSGTLRKYTFLPVSVEKTLLRRRKPFGILIGFKSIESGAGEQFLPLVCRAETCIKGYFVHRRRHGVIIAVIIVNIIIISYTLSSLYYYCYVYDYYYHHHHYYYYYVHYDYC